MLQLKRNIFLIFTLLFSSQIIASDVDSFIEPLQYFKKHYTKAELKKIHKLNTQILIEIEKKTAYPPELKLEQVRYKWSGFPFINEAHALGIDGKCFFGGWMTSQGSTWCHEPWKHTKNQQIKDFGPTYNSENYCGGKDLFRCNPVLFGKPKNPDPKLGRNPDRGICIKISSYDHVTRKCTEEAGKYLDELVDELKNDMKGLEQFLSHTAEILRYCEKDKLDYCDVLKSYLEKVTKRAKDCETEEAKTMLPKVVAPLDQKELQEVADRLAEKDKVVVKPVVVKKDPVVTPVKDAESKLKSKVDAYSNSNQTRRMIQKMKRIYTQKCSSASCHGNKGNEATGKCWRYVKHGVMAGDYADGYLEKNGQTYPYTASPSAKNAGKDFFERKEVGFTNLLKTEEYKNLTSKNAPVGAVLVYSGGSHGHIEVKASENEYISDFRSSGPIDSRNAYRRSSRMLIGIYVKVD